MNIELKEMKQKMFIWGKHKKQTKVKYIKTKGT